jgi:hypothetical protein
LYIGAVSSQFSHKQLVLVAAGISMLAYFIIENARLKSQALTFNRVFGMLVVICC